MNSQNQIRRNMIEELIKEVRGPRYGVDEIISYDPGIEYLTGVVIPRSWEYEGSTNSPDEETIVEIDDTISEDSSSNDDVIGSIVSNELSPKSMIKSFGVSFSLKTKNPKLKICATWGRYFEESEPPYAFDLKGNKTDNFDEKEIWKRYSFGEIFEIDVDDTELKDETIRKYPKGRELVIVKTLKNFETEKEITDKDEDGYVNIHIRRLKVDEDNYFISVHMINCLNHVQDDKHRPDIDKCLFQPSIRIICDEDIKTQHIELLNESEEELDFLYRDKPTVAFGSMCSAVWKKIDYNDRISTDQLWPDYSVRVSENEKYQEFLDNSTVRTEFVPLYPVTLPKFDLEENNKLAAEDLLAEDLANSSPNEIYNLLSKLIELYEVWVDENKGKVNGLENKYWDVANKIIGDEDEATRRMKNGLKLIRDEDLVYTAFCFANKTLALQNSWGLEKKDEFKWRPFQIAFFLMNIEDICDKNSKNRERLDLLWIPTGGGKTEAYLGIMAFTIALRRLKAFENKETGAGTSIISRYTLRLLSVQQFRRTLKMITAAEFLRIMKSERGVGWRPVHSNFVGDWIYGSTRFSTGLWVGGAVTPLHLLKPGKTMDLLKGKNVKLPYDQGEPAQILKCPICGSWLSVPSSGLNEEKNHIHIVINTLEDRNSIEQTLKDIFKDNPKVDFVDVVSDNHKSNFHTVSFVIYGKFTQKQFDLKVISKLIENDYELASLGHFNIGYFTSLNSIQRMGMEVEGDFDFEIWCTNPNCDLNNVEWYEGCPYPNSSEPDFPDGNYIRELVSPFENNSRMPIPAYLIDDHVYHRCPTVIISTADKIARLAFEPKACGIFGNVNYYNRYFGYNSNSLLPCKFKSVSKFNTPVNSLNAPDLIIQDELHLIDGPLGSLFGLYESMVSGIIETQRGNPKYIASTATISNAKKQVDLLFSKKLFQFPPHGLDISNNFFVKDYDKEELWDEEKAGRVYMGFYAPGKGPMTPQVRLWARMAKVSCDNLNDDYINNYWTTVGYFNSIKELGGVLALYRDDIKSRLENIGGDVEYKKLNEDNKEELSSRKSSVELPIILDNLERDGMKTEDGLKSLPKFDGIFTTSMFGTGVDISHLSLMIMTSQPKTTGSYIQATGRIGRKYGGLVVDFFKAGRPRDLNHYEMFNSFHSRIYLDVEPVSVSPFSKGCLSRGLGPSMVSFLRNANDLLVNWQPDDGKTPVENINSKEDFDHVCSLLKERLNSMENMDEESVRFVLKSLKKCIEDWESVAYNIENRRCLKMNEYYDKKPRHHVVLGAEGHKYSKNLRVVYKNAPQSLRDVEETIDFWV